ncbi:MAG: hypothetical protein WBA17_17710 [Saprospiraceae bacterium]
MFDFFLTIALVYFGYRAYNYYTSTQRKLKERDRDDEIDHGSTRPPGKPRRDDDDFIDFEEIK